MKPTLAGYAFAASPDGVAHELATRLAAGLCAECQPFLRDKWNALAHAFFVASGARQGHPSEAERERIGRAVDCFTGNGLPPAEQTPTGRRRGGRYTPDGGR